MSAQDLPKTDFTLNGQPVTTTVYPNGASNIVTRLKDGSITNVTGSATFPMAFEAGVDAILARIHPTVDYAQLEGADLVIEAATEREEIKRKIFEAAGKVLRDDAIMASNTSSIPITRMAVSSLLAAS